MKSIAEINHLLSKKNRKIIKTLLSIAEEQLEINKLLDKRVINLFESYKILFRIIDGLREEINKLKSKK